MRTGTVPPRAAKVRELRQKKGWSQEEMAAATFLLEGRELYGVSVKTVENIEAGKPVFVRSLRSVAAVLDVPVESLLESEPATPEVERLLPGAAPPLPGLIVGREDALRELTSRLLPARSAEDVCRVQVMTAMRGWPGIGKTTLACALAHDTTLQAAFADGVLWTSLGQQPDPLAGLQSWMRALGLAGEAARSIDEASGRLAAHLRGRRFLLIIDDVWEIEHARPFQVGGRNCALLVTTRRADVARALAPTPADVYNLPVLPPEQALELLELLAPDVVARQRPACKELVVELEGLPLALQVAGRLLQNEVWSGWGVKELLEEVRGDARRLLDRDVPADVLALTRDASPTVAALLSRSTRCLDETTRERFAYLGAFVPKPALFELEDLAEVWKVDDARPTARLLCDRGLVEALAPGRFQVHALLMLHARSLWTAQAES